ncbi:hypothetical protein EMMF5_001334 [Cystobasidiomycetes sp. EMM_F5]
MGVIDASCAAAVFAKLYSAETCLLHLPCGPNIAQTRHTIEMPSLLHLGEDVLSVIFNCVLASGYDWTEQSIFTTPLRFLPRTFPGRNERDLLMINKALYQIATNLLYERILLDYSTKLNDPNTLALSSFLLRSPHIAGEIRTFEFRSYEHSRAANRNAIRCMDVPVQQMMTVLQGGAVNLQHLTLIGDWSPLPAQLITRQLRSLTLKMRNCSMTVLQGVIDQNSQTLEKLVIEERASGWNRGEQTELISLEVNGLPLLRSLSLYGVCARKPDSATPSLPKLESIEACTSSSWLWQSSAHIRNLSIRLRETPDQDAWNFMMLSVQAQLPPGLSKLRLIGGTWCEDINQKMQRVPLSLLVDLPTGLQILELRHLGHSTTLLVQELLADPCWLHHLSQINITADHVYEDDSDYDSTATNDTYDDTYEMQTGFDGQRCLVRV